MVNINEQSLKRRQNQSAKEAVRLKPKGKWSSLKISRFFNTDISTIGEKTAPALLGLLKRNVVNPSVCLNSLFQAKQSVNNADSQAGMGKHKKRMPFCNEADTN